MWILRGDGVSLEEHRITSIGPVEFLPLSLEFWLEAFTWNIEGVRVVMITSVRLVVMRNYAPPPAPTSAIMT